MSLVLSRDFVLKDDTKRLCLYTEEVSIVKRTFELHHPFTQCPANGAPAQTQTLHTIRPPHLSLPTSSPKKPPTVLYVSPRPESPVPRVAPPLDSRDVAKPLSFTNPRVLYRPIRNGSDSNYTRLLMGGFVLCVFGVLFGAALVIRCSLKSSEYCVYLADICVTLTIF